MTKIIKFLIIKLYNIQSKHFEFFWGISKINFKFEPYKNLTDCWLDQLVFLIKFVHEICPERNYMKKAHVVLKYVWWIMELIQIDCAYQDNKINQERCEVLTTRTWIFEMHFERNILKQVIQIKNYISNQKLVF